MRCNIIEIVTGEVTGGACVDEPDDLAVVSARRNLSGVTASGLQKLAAIRESAVSATALMSICRALLVLSSPVDMRGRDHGGFSA
jgi:hypothetical protein